MAGLRIAPRYLLGTVLAALLIQEFMLSIRGYIVFAGEWNVPATFLAVVSVYAILKAIDTLDPDHTAGASANPLLEALLLIFLLAEFLLLLVVVGRFDGEALDSIKAMSGAMCVYYVFEPLYQLFAILDTRDGPARKRRAFYLVAGILTLAGYLAVYFLLDDPMWLFASQCAAVVFYLLVWQVHFRAKMRSYRMDAAS